MDTLFTTRLDRQIYFWKRKKKSQKLHQDRAHIGLLTSKSWGISRRARYSLASLVFISAQIAFEITTCRWRMCLLCSCRLLGLISEDWIGMSLAHFALRTDFSTEFQQAVSPRHPPHADAFPAPQAQRLCHVQAHLLFLFKVLAAILITIINK